jgi:predicted dehydrogenase
LGSIHTRILATLKEADLVGVVDSNRESAARVAAQWKTEVLDHSELIGRVQACVVAVPTSLHREVAEPLLLAGVSCLVEKPLARTLEEGRALVRAAETGGATLMVGHVERFNPVVLALLAENLKPRFLEAQRVSPYSFRSSDVGVVLDMMIHDIDLILHLVPSDLIDVQAVGVPVLGEHEDMANARLTFADGSVANVTASRVALKTERKLRLLSEGVYVTMDFHKKRGRLVRLADGVREKIRTGQIRPGILTPLQAMTRKLVKARALKVTREQEPLMLEDQEFLSAIAEAREPLVSGRHGLRAMEAASRVVASIDAHLRRLRESES